MTSYPFFKMAAVSHIELSQAYCRPPTKCNWGLRWVLKFRLDRIDSFGDIAIFVLWGFALKLPIYMVVPAAHAQNKGLIYFRGRNWPYILICGVDLSIHHLTSKGVAGRLRGVYWRSPTDVKARYEPKISVPSKVENRPKFCVFGENGVKILKCVFGTPKGTFLRETTSYDVLVVKMGAAALPVASWKNPQKLAKWTFFPLTFDRPYNTLALPCQRVIVLQR